MEKLDVVLSAYSLLHTSAKASLAPTEHLSMEKSQGLTSLFKPNMNTLYFKHGFHCEPKT